VREPKNFYRRLDEKSGIDSFEETVLYTIKIENEYAIIWENIDFSEDRATYIFKCLPENHSTQIQKISNAIVTLAQYRSTLSRTEKTAELLIFKNNYGFITSIRKQRGKNKPFSNWLEKLQNALTQTIPSLPTPEELENIKHWTPNIRHTPKINKPKNYKDEAIIKGENLETKNIIEIESGIDNKYDKHMSLLKALVAFNQYCTEKLKIEI